MAYMRYLFLLFLIPLTIQSQESVLEAEISDYLDHNGTMKQYEFAFDQLVIMMEGTYPNTAANEQQWDYLNKSKPKAVAEMKTYLTAVYKKYFTLDEVKEMSKFYKSESGRLLVKDRSKMTEKHKEELNTFYNSAIGKKILANKEVLTQEISRASEQWSRGLYETFVSVLANG